MKGSSVTEFIAEQSVAILCTHYFRLCNSSVAKFYFNINHLKIIAIISKAALRLHRWRGKLGS